MRVVTLSDLDESQVDMLTLVLIGSTATCALPRAHSGSWVYTPRGYK
ncbi:hypothetical protein CCP2SC5_950008 [Azospirillaceae bacterium]